MLLSRLDELPQVVYGHYTRWDELRLITKAERTPNGRYQVYFGTTLDEWVSNDGLWTLRTYLIKELTPNAKAADEEVSG
jgi:hypothetical protein